jgi:hypothetical protein
MWRHIVAMVWHIVYLVSKISHNICHVFYSIFDDFCIVSIFVHYSMTLCACAAYSHLRGTFTICDININVPCIDWCINLRFLFFRENIMGMCTANIIKNNKKYKFYFFDVKYHCYVFLWVSYIMIDIFFLIFYELFIKLHFEKFLNTIMGWNGGVA